MWGGNVIYVLCLREHGKQLNKCDSGVVGNARPCQGRDRGFEPRLSLFQQKRISEWISFFVAGAAEELLTRVAGSRLRCRFGRRKTEVPRTSCDRLSLFQKPRKVKVLRVF